MGNVHRQEVICHVKRVSFLVMFKNFFKKVIVYKELVRRIKQNLTRLVMIGANFGGYRVTALANYLFIIYLLLIGDEVFIFPSSFSFDGNEKILGHFGETLYNH